MTKEDELKQMAGRVQAYISYLNAAIDALDEKGKWIPCIARLPEKDGEYLVTLVDGDGAFVDIVLWQNIIGGRWVAFFDDDDGYSEIGNVIAWMPLPDPYQGEFANKERGD